MAKAKDDVLEKEQQTDATEEVSEKELLKEAELREKERKEREEQEHKEAKEREKEEKSKEKEEKVKQKAQVRVKPRHGKKYREIAKMIESKIYAVEEAIDLVLGTNPAKFDATVELHVKFNEKEKNIRGTVTLPGGVAKEKRVLAVDEGNIDDVLNNIKAGKMDFDIMVADSKVMPKLAQLAKVLGPKGLMPSPKAGTVVEDVKKAAEELKGGKVEFRADKTNIVHMALGKVSFGKDKIRQNYDALIDHMPKRVDSIHLTTTMGPSVRVSTKK